jgi:hypothetical protein
MVNLDIQDFLLGLEQDKNSQCLFRKGTYYSKQESNFNTSLEATLIVVTMRLSILIKFNNKNKKQLNKEKSHGEYHQHYFHILDKML